MNILIFCGYIDDNKTTDANVNIAKRLCSEIAKEGHNVTLAAIHAGAVPIGGEVRDSEKGDYKIALITRPALVPRHRQRLEEYIKQHSSLSRNTALMKYMATHPFSAAVIMYSYSRFYSYDDPVCYAKKFVKRYCTDNKIDAAVAMTFPFASVLTVFGSNAPCRKYIYQLDPYGLHETIPPEYDEKEFFERADGIFTTDILRDIYATHPDYSPFSHKIYTAAFPTLVKTAAQGSCPVELDSGKTNIVFCGSTHDNYRNPKLFLECMEQLIQRDSGIVASFVGPHNSPTLDSFAQQYPENIRIYPSVNSRHIPAIFDAADFLLNLGNTYRLQLPSKIFEYFATGKPVIHLQNAPWCTCTGYMQRYPAAFVVSDSSQDTADSLYSFIADNRGTLVPWQEVSSIFAANLPCNVASKVTEVLSGSSLK